MADVDNIFKQKFKYYKQKATKPSFDDVIDFKNCRNLDFVDVKEVSGPSVDVIDQCGLKSLEKWEVYELKNVPGLYFIPNPFTEKGQRIWSKRCVKEYYRKPHETNVDPFESNPDEMWESSCQQIKEKTGSYEESLSILKCCPIWKLRWATLGYHHNWNTKRYSEKPCSPMPAELGRMGKLFASMIGVEDFKAEAAIVNYYHVGHALSPHDDTSEEYLSAPLISMSFGLPAIFLIGGKTKDECPDALFIRSGDVIIMSGASRLAYHAVPRILESSSDDHSIIPSVADPLDLFLLHSRLNINIRQVHA
uniref:Fe2OG dioxygenase domain-containing protein n=1 Tax=Ciona savignyi TaxID=51511 RepID=H2ZQF6_CIOSA